MPLTARVWSLGKLLLLAGALVATFFAFALIGMRLALRAREVQVPDLVGTPVDRATQIAADIGLALRIEPNARPDERVAAGSVLQQEPVAGAAIRQQRSLRIWVSSGPRSTTMPGLIGQSERTARLRAGEEGIQIAALSEFRSPEYSADAVVSQDPSPGTQAPRVSLLVNRGEASATYIMPDLTGLNGERAAEALRTRGLRASIVGSRPFPDVAVGTVVRQQPAGGFQVGPSDSISLEVSR